MEGIPRIPMISFKLKESTENPDFKNMKTYLHEHYGEASNAYDKEFTELIQLRNNVISAPHDTTGLSLLKRYFAQLQLLKGRFPMEEGEKAAISFSWEDLYMKVPIAVPDIRLEEAAILYNIGALHSILGAKSPRSDSEGMKVVCTHFQCAAWAFQQVHQRYCVLQASDLDKDLLKLAENIMLAQAQECILEKSIIDSRNPNIISKVSQQLVEYYKQNLYYLDSESISYVVSGKVYRDWKARCSLKMYYCHAICFYYMGVTAEQAGKYGEMVSWFEAAEKKLAESEKYLKDIKSKEFSETMQFVRDVIQGKYESAKKDNDFIYHDKIPDFNTLAEPKGAVLVKGISFDPQDPEVYGADIFHNLVPMETHEAASVYSEEKAKLLREINNMVEAKNEELINTQISLQIDQDSFLLNDPAIPQSLLDCCAKLGAKPDVEKELVDKMKGLSSICFDVKSTLDNLKEALDKEEQEVNSFQKNVNRPVTSWRGIMDIKRDFAEYLKAYEDAYTSNQKLREALDLHLPNIRMLCRPLQKIRDSLPTVTTLKDEETEKQIAEAARLLAKVTEMKTQRELLVNQLRDSIHNDDVTKALLANKAADNRKSQTDLFSEALKKHDATRNILNQNLAAQANILQALVDMNATLAPQKNAIAEIKQARLDGIFQLERSFECYQDLLSKCEEGHKFYETLLQKIQTINRKFAQIQQDCAKERNSFISNQQMPVSSSTPQYFPSLPGMQAPVSMNVPTSLPPHPPMTSQPGVGTSGNMPLTLGEVMRARAAAKKSTDSSQLGGPGTAPGCANTMGSRPGPSSMPAISAEFNKIPPATNPQLNQQLPPNQMFQSSQAPPGQSFNAPSSITTQSGKDSRLSQNPVGQLGLQSAGQMKTNVPVASHNQGFQSNTAQSTHQNANLPGQAPIYSIGQTNTGQPHPGQNPSWQPNYTGMQTPSSQNQFPSAQASSMIGQFNIGRTVPSSSGQFNTESIPPTSLPSNQRFSSPTRSGTVGLPYQQQFSDQNIYQSLPGQMYGSTQNPGQFPLPSQNLPQGFQPNLNQPFQGQRPGSQSQIPAAQFQQPTMSQVGQFQNRPSSQPTMPQQQQSPKQSGQFHQQSIQSQIGNLQQGQFTMAGQNQMGQFLQGQNQLRQSQPGQSYPGQFQQFQPQQGPPFQQQGQNQQGSPFQQQKQGQNQQGPPFQQQGQNQQGPPFQQQGQNQQGSPFQQQKQGQNQQGPPFQQQGQNQQGPPFQQQGQNQQGPPFQQQKQGQNQQGPPFQQQGQNQQGPPFQQQGQNQQGPPFQQQGQNQQGPPFQQQGQNQQGSPFQQQKQNQQGPAFQQQGQNQQGPPFLQQGQILQGPPFQQQGPPFQQQGPPFQQQGPPFQQQGNDQHNKGQFQQHIHNSPSHISNQNQKIGSQNVANIHGNDASQKQVQQDNSAPPCPNTSKAKGSDPENQNSCIFPPERSFSFSKSHSGGKLPHAHIVKSNHPPETVAIGMPFMRKLPRTISNENKNPQDNQISSQACQDVSQSPASYFNNSDQQTSQNPNQQVFPNQIPPNFTAGVGQYPTFPEYGSQPPSEINSYSIGSQQGSNFNQSESQLNNNFSSLSSIDSHALPSSANNLGVERMYSCERDLTSSSCSSPLASRPDCLKPNSDLLSSSPLEKSLSEESNNQVLTPRVLTREDIEEQRAEEKLRVLQASHPHPLNDNLTLNRFIADVERYLKRLEDIERSDSRELLTMWKQLLEKDKESGKRSMAIARCYPLKNRSQDHLPYDATRICLKESKDDYINASFIDYPCENAALPRFVACQAPLNITLNDFWTMIFEQGCEIVVCLVKSSPDNTSKSRVVDHWPTVKGESQQYGHLEVSLQAQKEKEEWTERIIVVKHRTTHQTRTIVHFVYHQMNLKLPISVESFSSFINEIHLFYRQQRNPIKPIAVVCSSGCGRTGLFIACSILVHLMEQTGVLPELLEVVTHLWRQRCSLIEDREQLAFAGSFLAHYAGDMLVKRDIIVGRGRRTSSHSVQSIGHSGSNGGTSASSLADNLFSNQALQTTDLYSQVERWTVKPGSRTESPARQTNSSKMQTSPLPVDDKKNRSDDPTEPSAVDKGQKTSVLSDLPADLVGFNDPSQLNLCPVPEEKRRPSKKDFAEPNRGKEALRQATLSRSSKDDPFHDLDPLWSLNK